MATAAALRPKLVLLQVAKALGVLALARRLTRDRLRILCYHGGCIGDESAFNPKLFSHRDLIRQRLAWLRDHGYTPVSLDDAVRGFEAGAPAAHLPVVITVDDGWYSSREHILQPALQNGFPVTLYLATEVMQRQTPVLDVTLRYILWKAGPVSVALKGVPGLADGQHDLARPAVRAEIFRCVLAHLRDIADTPGAARQALEDLALTVGVPLTALALESRRFSYLTGDELRQLHRDGCDVQLHGHTHLYPRGDPQALANDVRSCADTIVGLGLPAPRHYCYPSGEFDDDAPRLLGALGVVSATTCAPGLVTSGVGDRAFLLPRFLDGGDVHTLEFEAEMSGLLEFARALRRRLRGARR